MQTIVSPLVVLFFQNYYPSYEFNNDVWLIKDMIELLTSGDAQSIFDLVWWCNHVGYVAHIINPKHFIQKL